MGYFLISLGAILALGLPEGGKEGQSQREPPLVCGGVELAGNV